MRCPQVYIDYIKMVICLNQFFIWWLLMNMRVHSMLSRGNLIFLHFFGRLRVVKFLSRLFKYKSLITVVNDLIKIWSQRFLWMHCLVHLKYSWSFYNKAVFCWNKMSGCIIFDQILFVWTHSKINLSLCIKVKNFLCNWFTANSLICLFFVKYKHFNYKFQK